MHHDMLRIAPVVVAAVFVGAPSSPPRDGMPTCVPRALVTSPIATDDGHLLFRGQTNIERSYIAVFKGGPCPGLDRFAAVSVETRTTRGYCGGDLVRVLHPPVSIAGPACTIDRLQLVDARIFDKPRRQGADQTERRR